MTIISNPICSSICLPVDMFESKLNTRLLSPLNILNYAFDTPRDTTKTQNSTNNGAVISFYHYLTIACTERMKDTIMHRSGFSRCYSGSALVESSNLQGLTPPISKNKTPRCSRTTTRAIEVKFDETWWWRNPSNN